ncbi:MAG: exonuclease domain-containing protein [Bacteroidetes bacterium]|nr:exonuclease domain-containing protein [Bacteroidota bacterium]MDA1336402.1 exonuclease domain-containing protein [Bacteroidota bacterium]
MKFAALDLECATSEVGNICEVGVVVFENGAEVNRMRSLVRPEIEEFGDWQRWNFDYSLKDTLKANRFPVVWSQVMELIQGLPVVAHNAGMVECKHLARAFSHHAMHDEHSPSFFCTLELARNQWPDLAKHGVKHVARHFGWNLDHHNPESDARICAQIVQKVYEERKVEGWDRLVDELHWTEHHVPQFQSRLTITSKSKVPRSRADYIQELVSWKPTAELDELQVGNQFVLSGFEQSKKVKLRSLGVKQGLINRRFIKQGIDFLVADEKMGSSKYAKCVQSKIPIISEQQFIELIQQLQSNKSS